LAQPVEQILSHLDLDGPKCAIGDTMWRALERAESFWMCVHGISIS
jgi:hypothetical protein